MALVQVLSSPVRTKMRVSKEDRREACWLGSVWKVSVRTYRNFTFFLVKKRTVHFQIWSLKLFPAQRNQSALVKMAGCRSGARSVGEPRASPWEPGWQTHCQRPPWVLCRALGAPSRLPCAAACSWQGDGLGVQPSRHR